MEWCCNATMKILMNVFFFLQLHAVQKVILWRKGVSYNIELHYCNSNVPMNFFQRFPESQALILAISVCYHTRLRIREEFEKQLAKQLQDTKCKKLALSDGAKQFRDEVTW